MKIECLIDGKTLSLSLNSNKPLSLILNEDFETNSVNPHCRGNMCGLCTVLLNGKAVLACMIPAFELQGVEITTFESYSKTRNIKDIEKAYESVGATPCEECYASHTLLIESLVSQGETRRDAIIREMSVLKCGCLAPDDEVAIVTKAVDIRRKRRVRRS